MKRKLIEIEQPHIVVCDNKECTFKVPNVEPFSTYPLEFFVDYPCPECGQNLLTIQDYVLAKRMINIANWINKYFSWICYFHKKDAKRTNVSVHCHDGIKIKNEGIQP